MAFLLALILVGFSAASFSGDGGVVNSDARVGPTKCYRQLEGCRKQGVGVDAPLAWVKVERLPGFAMNTNRVLRATIDDPVTLAKIRRQLPAPLPDPFIQPSACPGGLYYKISIQPKVVGLAPRVYKFDRCYIEPAKKAIEPRAVPFKGLVKTLEPYLKAGKSAVAQPGELASLTVSRGGGGLLAPIEGYIQPLGSYETTVSNRAALTRFRALLPSPLPASFKQSVPICPDSLIYTVTARLYPTEQQAGRGGPDSVEKRTYNFDSCVLGSKVEKGGPIPSPSKFRELIKSFSPYLATRPPKLASRVIKLVDGSVAVKLNCLANRYKQCNGYIYLLGTKKQKDSFGGRSRPILATQRFSLVGGKRTSLKVSLSELGSQTLTKHKKSKMLVQVLRANHSRLDRLGTVAAKG